MEKETQEKIQINTIDQSLLEAGTVLLVVEIVILLMIAFGKLLFSTYYIGAWNGWKYVGIGMIVPALSIPLAGLLALLLTIFRRGVQRKKRVNMAFLTSIGVFGTLLIVFYGIWSFFDVIVCFDKAEYAETLDLWKGKTVTATVEATGNEYKGTDNLVTLSQVQKSGIIIKDFCIDGERQEWGVFYQLGDDASVSGEPEAPAYIYLSVGLDSAYYLELKKE